MRKRATKRKGKNPNRALKADLREMRAIDLRIGDLEAKSKRGPLTTRQKELLEEWKRMKRAVRFDMSAKKNS